MPQSLHKQTAGVISINTSSQMFSTALAVRYLFLLLQFVREAAEITQMSLLSESHSRKPPFMSAKSSVT